MLRVFFETMFHFRIIEQRPTRANPSQGCLMPVSIPLAVAVGLLLTKGIERWRSLSLRLFATMTVGISAELFGHAKATAIVAIIFQEGTAAVLALPLFDFPLPSPTMKKERAS